MISDDGQSRHREAICRVSDEASMARLATRLTERPGIEHPILSAPMAPAGGGAPAAAVTRA
eukprot:gene19113-24182_t